MTQDILAQRLWTAAQNDSDLRARLRSCYRGRFDVCDALWWRANPLSPTPAGRPDPAAELIDLKAAVYRLHADPEPLVEFVDPITQRTVYATESEHRLRTRMREQAQEDAALDTVLAAAESVPDASGPGAEGEAGARDRAHGSAGSAGSGASESGASGSSGSESGGSGRPGAGGSRRTESGPVAGGPWRRRRFAALLVTAGALGGSLATLVGATLAGPADLPTDAGPARVSAGDSAPGPAAPQAAEPDVLQILDEPPNFADGKIPDLGHRFVPASIRSVGAVPAEAGYGVYVARRGKAQYCIVVHNADRTGTNACAGRGTLARTGLRVTATVMGTVSVSGNPRMPVLLEVYVVWAPDGSITTTSHPHVDACVAAPADC